LVRPETKYARSGDVHIAYQVVGDGPIDVVFVQGFISNLEVHWEDPGLTHLFNRLGSFARLIVFDKRGSGLSDRVTDMPNLETRMDDVRAVMDAANSERAALIGASEGGPMSILFAATYPERTRALVLYGAYAHFYSWVLSPAQVEAFVANAEAGWGTGDSLKSFAPNLVSDHRFRSWWARFERLGTSPAGAIALARMNGQIDVRDVLRTVRVPTLVIHRAQDARVNVAGGRYLAAHIPGAKYVEIPGVDHPIWVGDTDRVVDEIEEFLTGARPAPEPDRVLATVVCVEVGDKARRGSGTGSFGGAHWLDRMRRFRDAAETIRTRHRGREIGRQPDGIAASFDGPVRALRCALALRDAAQEQGMALRAGVHTGEVEIAGTDTGGAAVHVSTRIAGVARADEVLVSATVRDLVPGSGLHFADAGDRLAGQADMPRLLVLLGDEAAVRPVASSAAGPTLADLSAREREVLGRLERGLTNAEIAAEFRLSEHTVKRHVANILLKLDLANRAAAAGFASRQRREEAGSGSV
jgi:pimeloyl-ACP methyl ester carboxylesterase/DNA-binding CsgD family transcriptional regulator